MKHSDFTNCFCHASKLLAIFVFSILLTHQVWAQWTPTTFPDNEYPYNITASPNGTLMVTTFPGTGGYIYMSSDKGETWTTADVEGAVYSSTLTVGDEMFFGGRGQKLAHTSDNGLSWDLFNFSNIYNATDADIYSLAYHNGKLFAAVFGLGICYSDNMGATWQETDRESLMVSYEIDGRNTYTMESFNGLLYAIGANGIWTLNEPDMTWTLQRETFFAGQSFIFKDKLFIAYVIQNGLDGIEYTVDGENWIELPKSNDSLPSNDIRGFQTDGNAIFVGTFDQGVYYSLDEGLTWLETENWPASFEVPGVVTFLSIPMDFCFVDDEVFAASFEKGIFKMANPNATVVSEQKITSTAFAVVSPNPAGETSMISFEINQNSIVDMVLIDMTGRAVKNYHFGVLEAGSYQKQLDIEKLTSGLYSYILRTSQGQCTGKIVVQ